MVQPKITCQFSNIGKDHYSQNVPRETGSSQSSLRRPLVSREFQTLLLKSKSNIQRKHTNETQHLQNLQLQSQGLLKTQVSQILKSYLKHISFVLFLNYLYILLMFKQLNL